MSGINPKICIPNFKYAPVPSQTINSKDPSLTDTEKFMLIDILTGNKLAVHDSNYFFFLNYQSCS